MKQFVFLLLFLPAISSAGDIYKCTDSDGNAVYSQRPCSPQAEKIEVDTYQPQVSADTDAVAKSIRKEKIADLDAKKTADADYRAKVNQGKKDAKRLDKLRKKQLSEIDQQIAEIERQKSYSMNNYAGATRDIGLNEQLAQLKSSRIDVETKYQTLIHQARYPDRD